MKKILLAFDGSHFSNSLIDLVRGLTGQQSLLFTASFLSQADLDELWSYPNTVKTYSDFGIAAENGGAQHFRENIEQFKVFCQHHGIERRIHQDFFDFAIPELQRESRFSDLLVINSEAFHEEGHSSASNEYLQEAICSIECPVMVTPKDAKHPTSNILCYDGSASSVQAIKQFAYLFPAATSNATLLFHIKENGEDVLPDESHIEALAKRHFFNLAVFDPGKDPKKHFDKWLQEQTGAIIVRAAFKRSEIAKLLSKNFINQVTIDQRLPIFMAHR